MTTMLAINLNLISYVYINILRFGAGFAIIQVNQIEKSLKKKNIVNYLRFFNIFMNMKKNMILIKKIYIFLANFP